jgi:hypothetical protein
MPITAMASRRAPGSGLHTSEEENAADRGRGDDRGAEIRLLRYQQQGETNDQQVWPEAAQSPGALRLLREQKRAVEHQRELRELGGLELQDPRADPAL